MDIDIAMASKIDVYCISDIMINTNTVNDIDVSTYVPIAINNDMESGKFLGSDIQLYIPIPGTYTYG